jgi:hypothetical protein
MMGWIRKANRTCLLACVGFSAVELVVLVAAYSSSAKNKMISQVRGQRHMLDADRCSCLRSETLRVFPSQLTASHPRLLSNTDLITKFQGWAFPYYPGSQIYQTSDESLRYKLFSNLASDL